MTDDQDDLRVRLARLDPTVGQAAAPSSPDLSPRAHELLERTMNTPDVTTNPARRWLVAAAAAATLTAGGIGLALQQDGGATPKKAPTTLALHLPGGASMMSCMQFSTDILKDMSPAFAGTVTSVADGTVTLSVDHWYAGGTADLVTLAAPDAGVMTSIDGVEFETGKRYLVTAAEGTVNSCGYTGLATPDLEQAFATAFGG